MVKGIGNVEAPVSAVMVNIAVLIAPRGLASRVVPARWFYTIATIKKDKRGATEKQRMSGLHL